MKMEEISTRNEEPQGNNDNVVVAANSSILRIKLFNILLGTFLIFLGVSLLCGSLLYKKSSEHHHLDDFILSMIYTIVASWVIISGIVCVSAARCTKNCGMNAVNITFACLTICASAVAIYYSIKTIDLINQVWSCVWSYGKHYCDKTTPIRRRYHGLVLAGFVLVFCVAISIVALAATQISRIRRMAQQQAHMVPSAKMVQSSGVVTTSYPAGYPMSGGMTVAYHVPVSSDAPPAYSQKYTTAPRGGNPQMAYNTSAGQMQLANPTAMTENQLDAPPP